MSSTQTRTGTRGLTVICTALLVLAGCMAEVDDFGDDEAEVAVTREGLIVGDDDRVRITQGQATAYPWRAVAAVRWTPNTTTASCSAFKVGPRHLLSAAHCFYGELSNGSFGLVVPLSSFRLVMGQYGSGNAAANMPVQGRKLSVQSVYVPPNYVATRGTSRVDDWALVRVADGDSGPGWFRTKAWTNAELRAFTSPTAAGYPLHDQVCVDSPLGGDLCGGYQYRGAGSNLLLSASYIDTHADWQQGQSGGVFLGTDGAQAQRVALGIIHSSRADISASFARRITSAISSKVCQQIAAYPSTQFPNVPCTP
jgi:V8-like Glu-specific endopeptidase